ncbi:MAG: CoA-binding protein [Microcoleaceae cyanobacterium]
MSLSPEDRTISNILTRSRVIAVVGHSDKPHRTSYQIAQFLKTVGYQVYAVNPTVTEIDNQPCYPSLKAIPESIDIVNVFRRSEFLPEIVTEAITVNAKTLWTQLDIINVAAAETAQNAGLTVIMNRCIKIEYNRLNISSHGC